MFKLHNVHNIFYGKRLKVELICRRIIGRNGLRIVVDDDGFISGFLNRTYRMNGGVVELHTLSDPDRSGA